MTHADLVARAARWLRNTRGCGVVLTEFTSASHEIPDAIGWRVSEGWSILVECKASRADFRADAKKWHRRHRTGLGQERWYLAPPGLVASGELPDGWGLLECHERAVRVVVPHPRSDYAGPFGRSPVDKSIAREELPLALSALRRHYCRACKREIDARERAALTARRKSLYDGPKNPEESS